MSGKEHPVCDRIERSASLLTDRQPSLVPSPVIVPG